MLYDKELIKKVETIEDIDELWSTRSEITSGDFGLSRYIRGTKAGRFMGTLSLITITSPFVAFYSPSLAFIFLVIFTTVLFFFARVYINLVLKTIDKKIDLLNVKQSELETKKRACNLGMK